MATLSGDREQSEDACQGEREPWERPSVPSNARPVLQRHGYGGYECEFVQPPPSYFQTECSVCLLVLRDTHLATCCGHNFCKDCIERVQKAGKSCPLCNENGITVTYNRAYDMSLKQLEVYCTHLKIGCEWKGKLEVLDKHLNVDPELEKQLEGCAFVEVQCSHDGCGQSFQRRLISKHQAEECSKRPFSCDYCHDYTSTEDDVLLNHRPVCKCYPVSCPNSCTPHTIERQNLEKHLNEECPLQEVDCEFKYAGCETKLPRKDMADHVSSSKEMVRHMSLLARQNQALTAQLQERDQVIRSMTEELQERVDGLEQTTKVSIEKLHHHIQVAPVQIVMTHFGKHKRDDEDWYSEGFYTHPQGYKMCLEVIANGDDDEYGTHVSCFFCLMRGEFDNHLKWPFRADMTVQLLNQREDNGHHTDYAKFNEDVPEEIAGRVFLTQRATHGWGQTDFIPHSELGYNAATNCQYLMKDCLYFRVNVEVH